MNARSPRRVLHLAGRAPWLKGRNAGQFVAAAIGMLVGWGALTAWSGQPAVLLIVVLPFVVWAIERARFVRRWSASIGQASPVLLAYEQGGYETAIRLTVEGLAEDLVVAGPDHLRVLLPHAGLADDVESHWTHDALWLRRREAREAPLRPFCASHQAAAPVRSLRVRGGAVEIDLRHDAEVRPTLSRAVAIAEALREPPSLAELHDLSLPGWREDLEGWSREPGLSVRVHPHAAHLLRVELRLEAPLFVSAARRPDEVLDARPTNNVLVDNLLSMAGPPSLETDLEDEELVSALLEVVHGGHAWLGPTGARLSLFVPAHGVKKEWPALQPRIEALAAQLARLARAWSGPR